MLNDILFWLLPTGWLCSLAQFFIHRRRANTDDFISIITDVKREMLNVQRENIKLYAAVRELSAIISLAGACSFSDVCPINNKLQTAKTDGVNVELFDNLQNAKSKGGVNLKQMDYPETDV